eukprot:PLAT13408.1.p1 GENE.PLAT13408.1~~PLAT13408.1.p1  ORF type:complete len:471 (+),score=240.39 PLAT13408.1:60-1472(+)
MLMCGTHGQGAQHRHYQVSTVQTSKCMSYRHKFSKQHAIERAFKERKARERGEEGAGGSKRSRRHRGRRRSSSGSSSGSGSDSEDARGSGRKKRQRTSADVMNRVKHDDLLDANLFAVGWLDRFDGMQHVPLLAWNPDDEIPMHRIYYFTYRATVVWQRAHDDKPAIDRFFAAGGIMNVLREYGDLPRQRAAAAAAAEAEAAALAAAAGADGEPSPAADAEEGKEGKAAEEERPAARRVRGRRPAGSDARPSREGSRRASTRPNFFVSLRMSGDGMQAGQAALDDAFCAAEGAAASDSARSAWLRDSLSSCEALHMTLFVLRLDSEEDKARASEALAAAAASLAAAAPPALTFGPPQLFSGQRFLVRKPVAGEAADAWLAALTAVRDDFVARGCHVTDMRLTPHVTVAKKRRGRRGEETPRWFQPEELPLLDDAEQTIDELHLCAMRIADDGYYAIADSAAVVRDSAVSE